MQREIREEIAVVFITFRAQMWLSSLHRVWYQEGLITLWSSLVEEHREILFYLGSEQIINRETAAAAPKTSGHACAPTSRGLPVCSADWMSRFPLSSPNARADRSDLFVCFSFAAAWLYRMLCLCSSRAAALCRWDRPKLVYLWFLWHWKVHFKPFHFPPCSGSVTRIVFAAQKR